MLFKATKNRLFNDIWCYLVIVVLTEKLAFPNKQLKGVYCILTLFEKKMKIMDFSFYDDNSFLLIWLVVSSFVFSGFPIGKL